MPVTYDYANSKRYEVIRTGCKAPSSNWSDIRCPWCNTVSRAYWWSISGGGKKCVGCGAMHNSAGMTAQQIKPTKKGQTR